MSAQATAAVPSPDVWRASQARRRWSGWLFYALAVASTLMGLVMLGALLFDIFTDGARQVDWHFLSNYPSRIADNAGLRSALLGSLWMLAFTAIIAFPLGVGAAIYLEEYAPDNWLTRFIQLNIANLAGVPSIVYGLLGLGLFVRWLALGRVVLAGSMTMALLILPLIIVASREAIRAVPDSLREGSYALGATRWQMVRQTVLPRPPAASSRAPSSPSPAPSAKPPPSLPSGPSPTSPSIPTGRSTSSPSCPFRSSTGSRCPRRSSTVWRPVASSSCWSCS